VNLLATLHLNQLQRATIAVYFLAVAYCCLWVPWSVSTTDRYGTDRERLGYGWIWDGPKYSGSEGQSKVLTDKGFGQAQRANPLPARNITDFSDIDDFVSEQTMRDRWDAGSPYSVPDLPIVLLRLAAATAIGVSVLVLAGGWPPRSSKIGLRGERNEQ